MAFWICSSTPRVAAGCDAVAGSEVAVGGAAAGSSVAVDAGAAGSEDADGAGTGCREVVAGSEAGMHADNARARHAIISTKYNLDFIRFSPNA
jgi:hypothetical protein